MTSLSMIDALDDGARLDAAVVEDDRVAHDGAFLDVDAGRQHRVLDVPVDDAAQVEQRSLDVRAPSDLRRRVARDARADARLGVVHVQLRQVLQQVHVAVVVRLDRPDIAPVAVELAAEYPRTGLLRPSLGMMSRAEVVRRASRFASAISASISACRLKHVDAHRDQVATSDGPASRRTRRCGPSSSTVSTP